MTFAGLWLLLGLDACEAPDRPTTPPTVRAAATGLRLARFQQPAGAAVRVSLWLDAGSRDAAPPQAATLAAWLAAESPVDSQVFADGTLFAVTCAKDALSRCAAALRRAACAPEQHDTSPQALARALRKLQQMREASAGLRRSERLALQVLLGADVDGMLPLGQRQDDARVTQAHLEDFYRDHYGPERALLTASGEVSNTELDRLGQAVFAECRPARLPRRTGQHSGAGGLRLDTGTPATSSVATFIGRRDAAADLGQQLARSHPAALLRQVSVRSGTAVIATLPGAHPSLAHLLLDMAQLPAETVAPPDTGDPFLVGQRFIGGEADGGGLGTRTLALGVVDPAGERALPRYQALLRSAQDPPDVSVSASDGRRVFQLRNAGALVFAPHPSERMTLTIGFQPGTAWEGPREHGTTALVASVLAEACRPENGVAVPWISASAWGLVTETGHEDAANTARAMLRCIRQLRPGHDQILQARRALLASMTPADDALALMASQLSPDAPGQLSAYATQANTLALPIPAIDHGLGRVRRSSTVTVKVLGRAAGDDLDVLRETWAPVLRELSTYARQVPAPVGPPAVPPAVGVGPHVTELPQASPTPVCLVHLVGEDSGHHAVATTAGARLFAQALQRQLSARSGVAWEPLAIGHLGRRPMVAFRCHGDTPALRGVAGWLPAAIAALAAPGGDALQQAVLERRFEASSRHARSRRLDRVTPDQDEDLTAIAQDAAAVFLALKNAHLGITLSLPE